MSVRGIRLKSLSDIRRFVAKVTNQLHKDEITTEKARALAYLCGILCNIVKDTDLENRIKALEGKIDEL